MVHDDPFCRATPEGERLFVELHEKISESSSEKNIYNAIKGTGLEYVGQGDKRVVLLDPTGQYLHTSDACVVKINKYGEISANKTEVGNYEKITGEPARHLMRITDWADSYKWVVMPYVSTDVPEQKMIELEKTFIRNGWKITDVHQRNTARVQDRAVMIDYDSEIRAINHQAMTKEERLSLVDWKYK